MQDFGKQEHVFTSYQKFIIGLIDRYYGVTEADVNDLIDQKKKELK